MLAGMEIIGQEQVLMRGKTVKTNDKERVLLEKGAIVIVNGVSRDFAEVSSGGLSLFLKIAEFHDLLELLRDPSPEIPELQQ